MSYLGEIAALATALCWLGSSLMFAVAGRAVGAQATNQFRLYAALPMLFGLGLVLTGSCWPAEASFERISLLAWSGIIGLCIGDFGFFHALATIGPRIASVIMALWPTFTVGINALRGELPSLSSLLGIGLTVAGVTMVLLRSRDGSWRPELTRRQWLWGIVGAFIGALGQAVGAVLGEAAMAPNEELEAGVDPLLATIVRMVFATIAMQVLVTVQRQPLIMKKVVARPRVMVAALLGAVFGPVFGVWLSMVALRHADTGVASALMATTPVFMLPVSIWFYRARVGALGIVGTLLAVAGVAVCFVGGRGSEF